jgi:hypothetical protein
MEMRYCELLVIQEKEKGKAVLAALNGMVTVLGELNMDRLKFHLMSEWGKKMENE